MSLIIHKITVGELQTNCYVISCEITGYAFIIDPGSEPNRIMSYIMRNEFIPKGILLTHGHPDHTGAVKILRGELSIPLMIHSKESKMLEMIGIETPGKYLTHGEILDLGQIKFTVIHTPGHTEGSICIYCVPVLFSGDTLFNNGVGRTDLPGGSYTSLMDSLRHRLFVLPPDTEVYPGHGPNTFIKDENINR